MPKANYSSIRVFDCHWRGNSVDDREHQKPLPDVYHSLEPPLFFQNQNRHQHYGEDQVSICLIFQLGAVAHPESPGQLQM